MAGLLGHRRLAIVDVAGGHQPLVDEDGSVLVFNGEIYNFESLRSGISGCRWRTRSDTEVLLRVLQRGVVAGLPRLNGMFAFAFWDAGADRLWLARDAGGEKPVYFAPWADGIAFASELAALLPLLPATPAPDPEGVAAFLRLGYVPSPATIFAGVRKLEPGQWLSWQGGRIETGYFWQAMAVAETRPMPDVELRELLEDCVRSRLIGERRLGVFLSGGIDSTLVAALAAQSLGPDRTLTFSVGFEDPAFDETAYSSAVAHHLGTCHHHQRVGLGELRASVEPVLAGLDEPSADASLLPTYVLSRFAAGEVTVSLGGDGGDELFAGYHTHALHRLVGGLERLPGALALLRHSPLGRSRGHWFEAGGSGAALRRHLGSVSLYTAGEVSRWLPHVTGVTAPERAWATWAHGGDALADVLRFDFRYYLGDAVLQKVDRASMAHSLEVRAPLLDRRLVDYALGLPSATKFSGRRGKAPLRRLLAGLVPPALWNQRKQGFSVPLARWFDSGLLADLRERLDGLAFWGLPADDGVIARAKAAPPSRVPHRLWALYVLARMSDRYC